MRSELLLCAVCVPVFAFALAPASKAQDGSKPFSIDFVWGDLKTCTPVEVASPIFFVTNLPLRASKLSMTLTSASGLEVSGGTMPARKSGSYAGGEFSMRAPCEPGDYTWTATAQDSNGASLATASRTKPLP